MTFVEKYRVLIFARKSRVRFDVFRDFVERRGGGTLVNVFLRAFFDVLGQT